MAPLPPLPEFAHIYLIQLDVNYRLLLFNYLLTMTTFKSRDVSTVSPEAMAAVIR